MNDSPDGFVPAVGVVENSPVDLAYDAEQAILRSSAEKFLGDRKSGGLSEEDLMELEDLRQRVAELEERQDFSERLLAQRNEPARLEEPR